MGHIDCTNNEVHNTQNVSKEYGGHLEIRIMYTFANHLFFCL